MRSLLVSLLVASFACGGAPSSSTTTPVEARVVVPAQADPCLSEPWAWLPSDEGMMRMSIDSAAVRSSRFAPLFHTHFARHGAAEVVAEPMVRLAGAFRGEPNEGAVVVMRTGDALTSGLPRVAEDVVVHAEGSLAGFVPRFRCAAPEPGLFFAAFDPSSLPGLEMLNTVGLEVKTVLVKMSVDGDHLVGEVVMRFATALSPGPVLDALVDGMRDGLSELTTSAPEVDTTGTNVALRYVAASDEEASAWIERIARIMSDEPPMPVTDARAATRTVTPGRRLPSTTGSNFGVITLTPGFVPDPVTASGTSGGGVDVSTLAFGCVGFATTVPDHVVTLTAPFRELTFMVRGVNGDVSIMVERPDGTLLCNDDYEGTDPLVVGRDLPAGDYRVWIPSGANLNHAYTLGLTELRSVVPSSL